MGLRAELRSLNIYFPWFKVVAAGMIILTVVFLTLGMIRKQGRMETEMAINREEKAAEKSRAVRQGAALIGVRPAGMARRQTKERKMIALTFDDGPAGTVTPRILDTLKEKKAKATFFVVGKMAQAAPEVIQRAEREGHVVGSHTMGHVNLATLDAGAITADVAAIDGVFTATLGHATKLTRPPYGMINENVKNGIRQPLVTWTIDPKDWEVKNAATVRQHVKERAFDGAIVLLHDIYDSTADAVGGIIDDLRGEGYEFVTVPEMAQARGVKLVAGEVYGSFRP